MTVCLLYHDEPKSGIANMATDELLLLHAVEQEKTSLRFYSWIAPTLSIGYFQSAEDRCQHPASADCTLVRRASGGGAILHDVELTYSLAMPCSSRFGSAASEPYDLAHETLISTLRSWNIQADKATARDVDRPGSNAFLCFQRRTVGDVLIGDSKIAGSAQRRFKSGLLQHGSILLSRSRSAPELPGIRELASRCLSPSELAFAWQEEIQRRTCWTLEPASPTDGDLERIEEIAIAKFGCSKWTFRR
jgi:lipoate-protein ligase A